MAGTPDDPGLMVLSLQSIFALISKQETEYEFEVTCSYLEVYNEVHLDQFRSDHLYVPFATKWFMIHKH